ncbi:HelD family protein [Gordonia sp. DT30]|uniref:HelD family protein n=1 Tax=Gordonia sp. DT30 TaxID=3416546 RepID=UPI003CE6C403
MSGQNTASTQVDEEQRHVDAMYERLDETVRTERTAHERALAVLVDDPGDRYARDLEVARSAENVRRMHAAERSLCFGRIDTSGHRESLHIGRVGLRTESDELLLVDWRAEAARPFYAATMAAPMGVRRRRHVRLDGRHVVDVTDEILDGSAPTPEDVVGDGPLASALSAARTGRMQDAAATLQSEQDAIVRSPHRGIMVVDGGPGTGKTIVALHRAAYVLYAFPAVADRGVLVFGPNRRFLTYISEVLPSLGENDVQLATMADLVGTEDARPEPDSIARIKGRVAMAEGLSRWVQRHQPRHASLQFPIGGDTIVFDSGTVDGARRRALQGGVGHNRARELFAEFVVDDLVNELEQRSARETAEFEAELEAIGIDLDRLGPDDRPHTDLADDSEIDWEGVREELLEDRAIDRVIAKVWQRLDADEVVRGFLNDRDALTEVLPDVSAEEISLLGASDDDPWGTADLALLDEARALVDGGPPTIYGHLVVDEAQQLSEMGWRALMRRCPARSMTIVGDLAQAGPATTIRSWADALSPFVDDRFIRHTLTVNYRTTAEIISASASLLGQIAPDQQPSRSIRHGEPPRIVDVADDAIGAAVEEMVAHTVQAHPDELIGVVATTNRSAFLESRIPQSAATVVAAPDARGLEFDTVIIVDPAAIRATGEAGLRDLYVAQTRATKRLVSLRVI